MRWKWIINLWHVSPDFPQDNDNNSSLWFSPVSDCSYWFSIQFGFWCCCPPTIILMRHLCPFAGNSQKGAETAANFLLTNGNDLISNPPETIVLKLHSPIHHCRGHFHITTVLDIKENIKIYSSLYISIVSLKSSVMRIYAFPPRILFIINNILLSLNIISLASQVSSCATPSILLFFPAWEFIQ